MEVMFGLPAETFTPLKRFYHHVKKPHLAYWRLIGNQGRQLWPTARYVTEGILDHPEPVEL